ncbi:MAG TPA: hypothetical protein VF789_16705 [Thermoanaerobaculia bacterium]
MSGDVVPISPDLLTERAGSVTLSGGIVTAWRMVMPMCRGVAAESLHVVSIYRDAASGPGYFVTRSIHFAPADGDVASMSRYFARELIHVVPTSGDFVTESRGFVTLSGGFVTKFGVFSAWRGVVPASGQVVTP